MKHLVFGLFIAFGFSAMASVQILKVEGGSHSRITADGIASIYGGTAGAACTGAGLCNSCLNPVCATKPFCACNEKRITDAQTIKFTVKSDSKNRDAYNWAISNAQGVPTIIGGHSATANGAYEFITTWGDLCKAAGSTSCEGVNASEALLIGLTDGSQMLESGILQMTVLGSTADMIDDCTTDAGGVCNFRIQSSKNSVNLVDVMVDSGFEGFINTVRVFGSTQDFAHASPMTATFTQDLKVNDDNTIDSKLNLKSHEMNFFRVATVDFVGNVSNFTSDANITNYGKCVLPSDTDAKDGCRYRFTPQSHK